MKNTELLKRIREEYQIPLQSYAPPLKKRFAFQAALSSDAPIDNTNTNTSNSNNNMVSAPHDDIRQSMHGEHSPIASQRDGSNGQKRQREDWCTSTRDESGGDGAHGLIGAAPCYEPHSPRQLSEGRLRLCSRPVLIHVLRGDTGRTVRFRLQFRLLYQWAHRHEFYHSAVGQPNGLELTETLQATVEHEGLPASGQRGESLDEEAASLPPSARLASDSHNHNSDGENNSHGTNNLNERPSYFFEEAQTSRVARAPSLPPHLGPDPLRWLGPQTPTLALFALLKCCAEEALVLDETNKMFLYRGRNAQSAEGKHHLITDLFSRCFAETSTEEEPQQQEEREGEPLTICIIKKWT